MNTLSVVMYRTSDSEFCVLRSEILPSQRQVHKTTMYAARVIINQWENYILTVNCLLFGVVGL